MDNNFPHPLPWPHDVEGIIKEAISEYVGDGDGMDAFVLQEYNKKVRKQLAETITYSIDELPLYDDGWPVGEYNMREDAAQLAREAGD